MSPPEGVLGYQDEVWRSRLARPDVRDWARGEPLRMYELPADPADRGSKALACYGLRRGDTGGMLRFITRRPVSRLTEDFLASRGLRLSRHWGRRHHRCLNSTRA